MAKKNRGKKNQQLKAGNQPKPDQIVIQDFGLDIRYVDTNRKSLSDWRNSREAAIQPVHPTRKLLYDLYDDIMLDDHLVSVTSQRRLAVTNTSISFLNNGEPVDSINQVINSECFDDLLEFALDSRFYGFSLVHADFRNNICELVPRAHVHPLKRMVTKDPYDMDGIDYAKPPYSNFYAPIGKPKDLGLLIIAAVLVIIKRGNLSDWAQFNEIFGQPLRKGEYDPYSPGQKDQLSRALQESGAMSYVVVPKGSSVEFIEANKSGASETYDALYERMEKGLSKLIIGQTMTTDDGSSKSQGEVHERVAGKISRSDRMLLARVLNGTVRQMLIAQGYPEAANGEFQFVDEEETITKEKRLTMDLQIHSQVAPIKKEYFESEYNVEFDQQEMQRREQEQQKAKKEPVGKEPGKERIKMALSFIDRFKDFF